MKPAFFIFGERATVEEKQRLPAWPDICGQGPFDAAVAIDWRVQHQVIRSITPFAKFADGPRLDAAGWLPTFVPFWHTPLWLAVLTWIILTAAWLWMLLAQWHMGASWRIGIDAQRATALVTHGLFRVSRNPIFLSLRCAVIGLLVLSPTAPVLALTVASELLMQIQVRLEETHLTQLHGASYKQYCHAVRRWL